MFFQNWLETDLKRTWYFTLANKNELAFFFEKPYPNWSWRLNVNIFNWVLNRIHLAIDPRIVGRFVDLVINLISYCEKDQAVSYFNDRRRKIIFLKISFSLEISLKIRGKGRRFESSVWQNFLKVYLKFESTSLGAVLSSHDRCVTYSASNLIMVLYSSLKREPAHSTALWRLRFKSRVWNSRVTETKNKETVASKKNFCCSTCLWQVLANKKSNLLLYICKTWPSYRKSTTTSTTTTTSTKNDKIKYDIIKYEIFKYN